MLPPCMQRAHDGLDVQEEFEVEHEKGQDISFNMNRDGRVKYITFFEDGTSRPGKKTAVWELDKGEYELTLFLHLGTIGVTVVFRRYEINARL